jgi:hypothetical protein
MLLSPPLPPAAPTPMAVRLDLESLTGPKALDPALAGGRYAVYPAGQRLGLVGVTLTFGGAEGPYLGPSIWGSVRGPFGGLVSGGLEGGWRFALGRALHLESGLLVAGAGGGGAPVGGGLMLRGHLGLAATFGNLETGLAVSRTTWPGGSIASTQGALTLGCRFDGPIVPAGTAPALWSGMALREHRLDFTSQVWNQAKETLRPTESKTGLVGVAWSVQAGPHLFWTTEAAAAAQGDHSGYMELFAGGGLRSFLDDGRRWGVRATVLAGSGGGGYVGTGGGLLVKGGIAVFGRVGATEAGLEAGVMRSPGSNFQTRTISLRVGRVFSLAEAAGGAATQGDLQLFGQDLRLRTGMIRYTRAQREDSNLGGGGVDLLSLGADLMLSEHLYALGEGAFATRGAGAYSIGVFGLGLQTGAAHGQRLLVELRAGAGGGANLATAGGALIQPMAGWMWEGQGNWGLRVLGGWTRSLKGKLDTPVLEAGMVFRGAVLRGQ